MNQTYDELIQELVLQEVLERDTPLFDAFTQVDRVHFVRDEDKDVAYMNSPLYLGYGQTVSQPYTVAFMLRQLNTEIGNKVLEIGYGSGWQTVILSFLVGDTGEVHATEIVPEVKEFGEGNIKNFTTKNVTLYTAHKGDLGVTTEGPYDRIISGAAAEHLPESLVKQLAVGGTMVLPVQQSIVKVTKDKKGEVNVIEYPGFVFVPLVT